MQQAAGHSTERLAHLPICAAEELRAQKPIRVLIHSAPWMDKPPSTSFPPRDKSTHLSFFVFGLQ